MRSYDELKNTLCSVPFFVFAFLFNHWNYGGERLIVMILWWSVQMKERNTARDPKHVHVLGCVLWNPRYSIRSGVRLCINSTWCAVWILFIDLWNEPSIWTGYYWVKARIIVMMTFISSPCLSVSLSSGSHHISRTHFYTQHSAICLIICILFKVNDIKTPKLRR